jgi:hypothetical protein
VLHSPSIPSLSPPGWPVRTVLTEATATSACGGFAALWLEELGEDSGGAFFRAEIRPRRNNPRNAGACAQRVVGIYVMADPEWLTLTKDFCEAYSAGISLVS